jgi:hypothetical protein
MIRRLIFILALIILISSILAAQDEGFGLGLLLGEPTGVSFKNWLGHNTAFAGGAAWSFEHRGSLHFHMDYLLHNFDVIEVKKGRMALYYGIGGRIRTRTETRVGVRIPIGLNYFFEKAPIDIFMEIAPLLDLTPKTEFYVSGGIGARYYF